MPYPSDKADSLEAYVRKTISLSPHASHVYSAIRWLERDRSGFCKPVFAGYRDISNQAGINHNFAKPALLELVVKGVCKVEFGLPIKSRKQATSIQRLTLEEIKLRSTDGEADCHLLARSLNERPFLFDGKTIKPTWTVGKTGRVCSSQPNIQGKPSDERVSGLRSGLQAGQCIIHADIRQADPTVIKLLLGVPQNRDLYQEYMAATGVDRTAAKKQINTLAYCKNSTLCFKHWPDAAQAGLRDYVEKLDAYKAELLTQTRKQRQVATISGRIIAADVAERLHAGKPFCWRVQGTVADIINRASLSLLDHAAVLIPIHDAILAVVPREIASTVAEAITKQASKFGIPLAVREEPFDAA